MDIMRDLTAEDMAQRVLRYVPELDGTEVCRYLKLHGRSGLRESDVHCWVRFFDQFVIDEGSKGK